MMSSLGRTLKTQAPLSPLSIRARQATLRRTHSNTSETSCTSPGYPEPFVLSGANTPVYENRPDSRSSRASEALSPGFPGNPLPRHNSVRPIAIEMPHTRRASGAPTSTPPEPLSARGDRVGGYFPFHEDPQARVQRTHPFHPDSATKATFKNEQDRSTLNPNLSRSAASSTNSPFDTTPVTSYIPSGVHDSLLPMGKYYPSNYEKRSQQNLRPSASAGPSSTAAKSDSQVPTCTASSSAPQQSTWNDSDVKKKLQQYQRDMIAQATLAMGSAAKNNKAVMTPTGIAVNGVPIRSQSLGGATPAKPLSPRLLPLGSPGPVTPMELESSEGSYLDKGRGSPAAEKKNREDRPKAGKSSEEEYRRRKEPRSPPAAARAF